MNCATKRLWTPASLVVCLFLCRVLLLSAALTVTDTHKSVGLQHQPACVKQHFEGLRSSLHLFETDLTQRQRNRPQQLSECSEHTFFSGSVVSGPAFKYRGLTGEPIHLLWRNGPRSFLCGQLVLRFGEVSFFECSLSLFCI